MEPYQVLSLRVKVDLQVMVMNGYYTFPKGPGQDPCPLIQSSAISWTLVVTPYIEEQSKITPEKLTCR